MGCDLIGGEGAAGEHGRVSMGRVWKRLALGVLGGIGEQYGGCSSSFRGSL